MPKSARPSKNDRKKPIKDASTALILPGKRPPSPTRAVRIQRDHPGKYNVPLSEIPKDARTIEADLAALEALAGAGDTEIRDIREDNQKRPSAPLNAVEKSTILRMYHGGYSIKAISTFINRGEGAVRKCIEYYRPTMDMAKARLQAGAEHLAERVLAMGSVEESLEVLDRLDVLPKRSKEAPQTAQQFNIIVGGGSGPSLSGPPVTAMPSQAQIEAAKDAQIVPEGPKEA